MNILWKPPTKFIQGFSRCFCSTLNQVETDMLAIFGKSYKKDCMTNIGPNILEKLSRQLHLKKNHPLEILKRKIVDHFHANYRSRSGGCVFASIDNLSPVVSVEQNFDSLLVPNDHVSRSKIDNYYVNSEYVLRSHTTAHERDLIRSGWNAYLNTGDVYRRDEIDSCHYPVFHQMEGVRIFETHEIFQQSNETCQLIEFVPTQRSSVKQGKITLDATTFLEFNLKYTLSQLVEHLFGEDIETRWVNTYFPFTHPSWELEIKLDDHWMEMLGCGILEQNIMEKAGAGDKVAWAFGLGLERFAMKLYNIPDIRLFWSEDDRFLNQFASDSGNIKFKPFSKYPPSYKDISFWAGDDFSANDLYEVVRNIAGDVIEQMCLVDQFKHPETERESFCYRITYRAMDRTLVDDEVNAMQKKICDQVEKLLPVQLR